MGNRNSSKLKKFFMNKKIIALTIFADLLLLALYIFLQFYVSNPAHSLYLQEHPNILTALNVVIQFLIIAFSIISTTLFTSWMIETKDRNNIYKDFICNEFLGSPDFYNGIDEEKKQTILRNLERESVFNGIQVKQEMYESIKNKLNAAPDLFYNKCEYNVDCTIDGSTITKVITRTTEIFASTKSSKKGLELIKVSYADIEGIDNFILSDIEINGSKIDKSHIDKIIQNTKAKGDSKCGYNKTCSYKYKKRLNIPAYKNSNKGVSVVITYITKVKCEDTSYVCRVRYPCKSFSMDFRLSGLAAQSHIVSAHPFGFIDAGRDNGNIANRQSVNIRFNDWIFEDDGVAVVISQKNDQ